jgi:hypothetical protein
MPTHPKDATSRILASVHATAKGFHAPGVINDTDMSV